MSIQRSPLALLALSCVACNSPAAFHGDGDDTVSFAPVEHFDASQAATTDGIEAGGLGHEGIAAHTVDLATARASHIQATADAGALGSAVASVGDLDGDGREDVAVGAWSDSSHGSLAGAAYVFTSGAGSADTADAVIYGDSASDYAGWTLGAAGDVDGDGRDDLFVSAHGDDGAADGAGAVFFFLSPVRGALTLADADVVLRGASEDDGAGASAASLGDVNGDGYDDFAVGAPGDDTGGIDAGAAYVFFGPLRNDRTTAEADCAIHGKAMRQWVGAAVAAAGDVNGDGQPDLLVGATGDSLVGAGAGAAFLFHGPLRGTVSTDAAAGRFFGAADGDQLGAQVASAGDLNRDGFADIVIGAPMADGEAGEDAGAAYVFLGPVEGSFSATAAAGRIEGGNEGAMAGAAVASAGDVDGDAHDDLLVGTPGDSRAGVDAGAAVLFYGPFDGNYSTRDADVTLFGVAGDRAGAAVARAGDQTGDFTDELILGAPGARDGAGAAWVVAID